MREITGNSLQGRILYTKNPKKKICKNCDSEFWAKAKYTEGYQDYSDFCCMAYRQDRRRKVTKRRKISRANFV